MSRIADTIAASSDDAGAVPRLVRQARLGFRAAHRLNHKRDNHFMFAGAAVFFDT